MSDKVKEWLSAGVFLIMCMGAAKLIIDWLTS